MFNKDDLTTRHVVKIRDGRICMLSQYGICSLMLTTKFYISDIFLCESGVSFIDSYDKNLKAEPDNYDIMAIKEYNSTAKAISIILNEIEITDWDWIREEKSPEQIEKEQIMEEIENLKQRLDEVKTF